MYFQVSTATSLALSHEVNPGGQEHQFWLKEGYLGQTSAVCVNVDAAEWEPLQAECAQGLALWEAGGEEEGEEEVEVASPPCASCWTLWRRLGCDGS